MNSFGYRKERQPRQALQAAMMVFHFDRLAILLGAVIAVRYLKSLTPAFLKYFNFEAVYEFGLVCLM